MKNCVFSAFLDFFDISGVCFSFKVPNFLKILLGMWEVLDYYNLR